MRFSKSLIILALSAGLAACGDSDNNEVEVTDPVTPAMSYEFTVHVTNLTNAQPLSPIAAIAHTEGMLWQIGEPASAALELMAEGGDNSELLAADFNMNSSSAESPLLPGEQVTLMLSTEQLDSLKISLATMLVNTNDAFTGLNAIDVSSLAVNESLSRTSFAYDAGTEANSEAAGTIPGPADSGEGYNEMRDDIDRVAMHPGVISQNDGLTNSVLTSQHKFDNPVARFTITRTQ
ncbi:spondin domain-containing protein [Pseudoalteromonas sp. ACER1]|uniref:Spondin domain-containing protein n=1 Tax=Pseudoalteromonas lipolytica TaxID=570156 RepID=A0ABU8SXH7_9GAMM|nr:MULTISPECIES: spondin domain-containing protein [unclassified Pseudoalteromonas]MCF2847775.1 spondin domain-containing protein [Pseudoalteromonas sp. PAST1]MCO7211418.1 spondin domain-containing protein [Pseudoalteromonas sp. ACER1]MED5515060.1 spondin domain-containing protein [Pseudomonadota bacterium]